MSTLSIESIQQAPRALSLAHALAAADQAIQARGTNPAESLVFIRETETPSGHCWHIQYASRDSVNHRGGGLIVEVDAATGVVRSVLRGQ